jgi:hypothetical protein
MAVIRVLGWVKVIAMLSLSRKTLILAAAAILVAVWQSPCASYAPRHVSPRARVTAASASYPHGRRAPASFERPSPSEAIDVSPGFALLSAAQPAAPSLVADGALWRPRASYRARATLVSQRLRLQI